MSKRRTSLIWTMPKEDFEELIKNATTFTGILTQLGFPNRGTSYINLKRRIEEEGHDVKHIYESAKSLSAKGCRKKSIPNENIFVKNSNYDRFSVKGRILRDDLVKYKCEVCSNVGEWLGKELILRLDHINGISNDHRLENLRFLCPNCDAQTDTYCGKNTKHMKKENHCLDCGKKIIRSSKRCKVCAGYENSTRKVDRPSYEQLLKEIDDTSKSAVGRKYGVSQTTVRKWVKQYEKELK